METFVYVSMNALMAMSTLCLISLGFWVVLTQLGIFNFAHGEFVMLGAYGAVAMHVWRLDPWLSVFVGGAMMAILGCILAFTVMPRVVNRPLDAILLTWGLGLVLQQLVELLSSKQWLVKSPIQGSLVVLGASLPPYRLFLVGACAALVTAVLLMMRYTRFGLEMRAAFQDAEMARVNGINAKRVTTVTFVSACTLCGVAGALIAPLVGVYPGMGSQYLTKTILAVVMGGPASVTGVLGGAALIGGSESALSAATASMAASASVIAFAVVLIRMRPSGLFVRKEVADLLAPKAMK